MRMKDKLATSLLCGILLLLGTASIAAAQQKDPAFALQRGYRTGYSDGYMAGYRDIIDGQSRGYDRHDEYLKANRTYANDYGSLDDFRDGYQQGFESGYDTGFDRRSFESNLPASLKKRGALVGDRKELIADANAQAQSQTTQAQTQTQTPDTSTTPAATTTPTTTTSDTPAYVGNGAVILIPKDTELIVELQNDLSTETNREGDKFTAKVVSPSELVGATIEGRISKITKPNKLKRRGELSLSFDRIVLNDNRWSNMSGSLIEVMAVKGDNIKRVDAEGTAIGQSSVRSDAIKVGGAATAGFITGAVIGGPPGAAIGAGVGAAFGVGAVVIERGKHIKLTPNQQLRIRTAYETQIR